MRSNVVTHEVQTADNHAEVKCLIIPGSKMTGPIMGRLRGLPPVDGVILIAKRVFRGGGENGAIALLSQQLDQKFAPTIFVPPTNYKIIPFYSGMVELDQTKANSAT